MEPTSNASPVVNRFFTVPQIVAFNQPPMPEALKKVAIGGGAKAEYLEGEYIRIALNMLVGQGMWELKTHLVSQDVRPIKKDIMQGGQKVRTEEWIGVSAVIHTQLIISARDGSDAKLIYEATAVGNGMNHPDKGISDPLDKAIKSAETDTLKRCSINLGRVFGLDLRNKITKNMLPQTVKHFESVLAEAASRRAAANDQGAQTIEHRPLTIEDQSQKALEPAPVSEVPATAQPSSKAEPTAMRVEGSAESASPVTSSPASVSAPAGTQAAVPIKKAVANEQERPAAARSAPNASPETAKNSATNASAATPAGAVASAPDEAPWELSLIPSNFEEWLHCIRTMAARVMSMENDREIDNFIRSYDKLIKKLPVFPKDGETPERNFVKRWDTVVNKRREQFAAAKEAKEAA